MASIKSIFRSNKKETNSPSVSKKQSPVKNKPNIQSIFNLELKEATLSTERPNANLELNRSEKRIWEFSVLLSAEIVSVSELKKSSWLGIPHQFRSLTWKYLLGYLSTNKSNCEAILKQKRSQYMHLVDTYIENPTIEKDSQERKAFKIIKDDSLRTLPESSLFRTEQVQRILRRVLYVWHVRNPTCGYVQGLNDVLTPFIITFLSDYIDIDLQTAEIKRKSETIWTQEERDTLQEQIDKRDAEYKPHQTDKGTTRPSSRSSSSESLKEMVSEEDLNKVEADCYWCLKKLLSQVIDNYSPNWPGIAKGYGKFKSLIDRADPYLLSHFSEHQIDCYHSFFKWESCLLLRLFKTQVGIRLFDTFLATGDDFFDFSLYLVSSILLKYGSNLKNMSFENLMRFLQNMPTKMWNEEGLSTAIAEAFVYQMSFSHS